MVCRFDIDDILKMHSFHEIFISTACITQTIVVIVNPEETLNEGAGTEGALLLFEFVQNP